MTLGFEPPTGQVRGILRSRSYRPYHGFTEGLDTPDLTEARALLDQLV